MIPLFVTNRFFYIFFYCPLGGQCLFDSASQHLKQMLRPPRSPFFKSRVEIFFFSSLLHFLPPPSNPALAFAPLFAFLVIMVKLPEQG